MRDDNPSEAAPHGSPPDQRSDIAHQDRGSSAVLVRRNGSDRVRVVHPWYGTFDQGNGNNTVVVAIAVADRCGPEHGDQWQGFGSQARDRGQDRAAAT